MKRILLIGSELGKGGAERSLSYLSLFLSRYYEVTLCILSGTDRHRFYPTCEQVFFVDPPPATNPWRKLLAWKYRYDVVRKLKKDTGCHICISFLEGPNYINVLTKGRERVVLSVRGSKYFDEDISGISGWLEKKLLLRYLFPKAEKIICVSRQLAEELNIYFGIPRVKLGHVYNIYDSARIKTLAAEPLSPQEALIFSAPVVVHSGRMHPQKKQDQLIRLWAHVRKEADARLLLLGDGAEKVVLLQTAADAGLSVCDMEAEHYRPADIYLVGYQANPFKFYAHSRLFVLCSGWEGFPNVLAEALICGLPALSADCPTGPREILDVPVAGLAPVVAVHRVEIGTLMPMLDATDLRVRALWVAELLYWLAQPKPSAEAFERRTERFSEKKVLQAWRQLIECA